MSTRIGKVFKAMADPTRRRILDLLREGDLSAGAIAEHFQMTKPAISHHLTALKEADLATERREGQQVIYTLREDSIQEAWDGFFSKFCGHKRPARAEQKAKRATGRT